jgi:hypothetical protein
MVRNKTTKANPAKTVKPNTGVKKGRKPKAQIDQLKPAAEKLFYLGSTYKEIEALLGVDAKYISKWADIGNWQLYRATLTTTKPRLLQSYYAQALELNEAIESREKGKRYADSKEGDTIVKLAEAIKKLEGEANISVVIEVGVAINDFVGTYQPENFVLVNDIFQAFITHRLNAVK